MRSTTHERCSPVAMPEPQFDELYRELILDHYRRPRNRGELDTYTYRLEGINPTCGDEVRLDIRFDGDTLAGVAFEGVGCSISQASASMMTDFVRGRSAQEAREAAGWFEAMLLDSADPDPRLGDIEALQGVARFPVRVKCAMLIWKVLRDGLNRHEAAMSRSD